MASPDMEVAHRWDLRGQLAELELIYRTAPVGLCFLDLELRFVRINETMAAINGKPVEQHLGRTIREVVPEIAEIVEPVYRRVIETAEPALDFKVRGTTVAAPLQEMVALVSYFPVLQEGRVIGVNTVVLDITERDRQDKAIRRQAEILAQVHDAVISMDGDGVIESWNDGAERLYGYSAEETVGQHVEMLFFPEDFEVLETELPRLLEKRGSYEDHQRHRKKCEGEIFVHLKMSLRRDKEGRGVGAIACCSNLTETRALQEELLRIAEQEQRRIGQELHDVTGQELTGLGYLARGLAGDVGDLGPERVQIANQIADGLERALGQIRTFSKGLIPVEVDSEGLKASLQELAQRISMIGEVECSFRAGAHVDIPDNRSATQLYRIAQEAVTNAIKHGGTETIEVSLVSRDGRIVLEVTDDGLGIQDQPPETGVGLKIMEFRARAIGAVLRVESRGEGGTRVRCSMPAPVIGRIQ